MEPLNFRRVPRAERRKAHSPSVRILPGADCVEQLLPRHRAWLVINGSVNALVDHGFDGAQDMAAMVLETVPAFCGFHLGGNSVSEQFEGHSGLLCTMRALLRAYLRVKVCAPLVVLRPAR